MTDESTRKAIFFDTGIFRKLISDKEFLTNFSNDFSKKYGEENFYTETTPFMLLEYLGVKIKKINEDSIIDEDKIKSIAKELKHLKTKKDLYDEKINELKGYIFESAEKKYLNEPILSFEALMERREKLKSASPDAIGKNFFNMMINKNFESKISDTYIHSNLAIDFYSRFNYEKYLDEKSSAIMRIEMINFLFHNHYSIKNNISQFRSMIALANGLDQIRKKCRFSSSKEEMDYELFKANKDIKLKRDLVDLELIQFVCLGVFDQLKKKLPATIVVDSTKKEVAAIKKRVRLFKRLLTSLNNSEGIKKVYGKIDFLYGEIIFVKKDGRIKEKINSSDIKRSL